MTQKEDGESLLWLKADVSEMLSFVVFQVFSLHFLRSSKGEQSFFHQE
jgi:hypothetical protein